MKHYLATIALAAVVFTAQPLHAQDASPLPEPRPADPEALASTIQALASALREMYVYPEVGATMADHLLTRLEEGHWQYVSNERILADYITEDLRAISGDRHLRVLHSPRSPSAPLPRGRDIETMRRDNFAFRRAEVLDSNIGYLRFDLFIDHEEAMDVAAAALSFLARADALIIDMRHNSGGSPNMIRYITSYFFEEPTLLNVMVDRNGEVVDEFHTLESVPGRRFPADLPIFVLTSNYTFSGAEEFAYNLKHLNRATVIGEPTGGGAHPTRTERLNDRFIVGVPVLRARNPITGTNWEGTGIKPHIEVSADRALDRALQEARNVLFGEKSLQEAGWPKTRAGAAAAAYFEAYGDDDAMVQFSKKFRAESVRENRSDDSYAAFWREFAEAAVPRSYVSRGDRELTVTAYLTRHDGRKVEATFRFEFDPEPPHGLRAIHVSSMP